MSTSSNQINRKYFLIINNQKEGPFSLTDLEQIHINSETLIWHLGLGEWQKAKNIPELNDILEESPPPIPIDNTFEINNDSTSIKLVLKKEKYNQIISNSDNINKLRNIIKKTLFEVFLIILIFVASFSIAYFSYHIIYRIYLPPMISDEAQAEFNDYYKIGGKGSERYLSPDALSKLDFGNFKFDNRITLGSELCSINTFRIGVLYEVSNFYAYLVFYIIMGIFILYRYLFLFLFWLFPEDKSIIKIIDFNKKYFMNILLWTIFICFIIFIYAYLEINQ